MAKKMLFLSLLGLVLLSLNQAAVLSTSEDGISNSLSVSKSDYYNDVKTLRDSGDDVFQDSSDVVLVDDDDDEEGGVGEMGEVGEHVKFPLEEMDDDSLVAYFNVEDDMLQDEADEHVGFKLLREHKSLYTKDGSRKKRIAPLVGRAVFAAGRALFRSFGRAGRLTRSGSRVTRHYGRSGNYQDAVRDFNRLRPDNVRSFNGRISGRTGTMGGHRVTVRDGSSGTSRPTLEVRSHGGDVVRKFRYNP